MREPTNADVIGTRLLQKVIEPQGEHTAAQLHQAEWEWLVPGYIALFATRLF
jgi:hypothetical protein